MPIYEYACQRCEHQFELLQRISDDPVEDCPECGATGAVKKLVSRTSFILKGGGWYKDHYGLKSGGTSEGSAESPTKAETSSETGGSPNSSSSDTSSSASDTSSSSGDASRSSSSTSSTDD